MKVKGKVRNGTVVIEGPVVPPDGAEVQIEFPDPQRPGAWIDNFAGKVTDLPPSASRTIDQDLYGPGE